MTRQEQPFPSILAVDDEASALKSVQRALRSNGYEHVETCGDPREVLAILEGRSFDLLLLDLIMPHLRGEDLLDEIAEKSPELPVIVVTAEYDARAAVRCMKAGAVDYLLKPVEVETLVETVKRALEQSALRYEARVLREQFFVEKLKRPEAFSKIFTSDPGMLRLFAYLEAVSRGSHPVLITGETGTGKELVAEALHLTGHRDGPFVAVNVAGLDDTMFSDTLFGHTAGAYTGAGSARSGMVEKAGSGTLFLDEIGDLAEASQVKLLRLVQEGEYYPLGSDTARRLRARVVAATHREPSSLRQDLYYRLRSYHVRIPPLRERLADLSLLVDHFLDSAARDLEKAKPSLPPELFLHLSNYAFPGNIRELQSMVFEAVARHEHGVVSMQSFLDAMAEGSPAEPDAWASGSSNRILFPFPMPRMKEIESAAVGEALERVQGNQSAAARMLGLSRPTIARYLRSPD